MDQIVIILVIGVVVYLFVRVRGTHRRARRGNRGDQIKRQLEELRKKRDED